MLLNDLSVLHKVCKSSRFNNKFKEDIDPEIERLLSYSPLITDSPNAYDLLNESYKIDTEREIIKKESKAKLFPLTKLVGEYDICEIENFWYRYYYNLDTIYLIFIK